MDSIALALILATLVERFVEYIIKPFSGQRLAGAAAAYLGLILGILAALAFQVDFLSALGLHAVNPLVGEIVSGFVVGGGSHLVNDVFSVIRGGAASSIEPEPAVSTKAA